MDMHGGLDFEAITQQIGHAVTEMHEKGDVWANRYASDAASLMAHIKTLEEHVKKLEERVAPQVPVKFDQG